MWSGFEFTISNDSNSYIDALFFCLDNCRELVEDFICKAKQLQYLISILPPHESISNGTQSTFNQTSNGHSAPQALTSSPASSPPNHVANETQSQPNHLGDSFDNELESDREEFIRLQNDIEDAQAEYEQALSIAGELSLSPLLSFDYRNLFLSFWFLFAIRISASGNQVYFKGRSWET